MPRPTLLGAGRVLLACAFATCSLPATAQSPAPQPEALPDLEQQQPRPPWVGIRAAPGVHVQEVIAGGPAERAGLKKGDLITSVDFQSAIEEPGLMGVLREKGPGETLVLDVLRDGADLRLRLVLGEFPMDLLRERERALEEERRKNPPDAPAPPRPDLPQLPGPGAVMRPLGEAERPFLGVTLQELNGGLAVYLGLPADSPGVLVEHVHEDSPAAEVGLKAGDVLLSFGGVDLHRMTQLGERLRERAPGDAVPLEWWSANDGSKSATVRLGARQKQIWAVSPPDRDGQRMRDDVRESLEARLRMLEEQSRRVDAEQAIVLRRLEELARKDGR